MIGSRNVHRRPHHATLVALVLGSASPAFFAPAVLAQDKLERELSFVRGLARDMRFIELAREEAERLAGEFRGAGELDRIAQLSVQIAYYGARTRPDRALQRALFKEAIEKSKELIDRSRDANVQLQARMTLADAVSDFGQFLTEDLEIARETAPENVAALEEDANEVFRVGIEACSKVMDALQPQRKDETKNTEFLLLWMRRGVLQREKGRAVRAEREVQVQRAVDDLTDLVLEAGEETAIGLRGLFEIGQCYEVLGDTRGALDSYNSTIKQISTALTQSEELGLSGDMQSLLFEMLQEVTARTGEVMVRTGDPGAADLFARFREMMKNHGEKGADLFDVVDARFGHQVLLAESRLKAESGDPKQIAEAVAMVQRINDKHPNDYTGVKAKALLRDILSLQQSLVSGKLLLEIAKGELQNKNQEEGIKNLRRALATMTPEEQQTMALEAYELLGRTFGTMERSLEATIALTEGLKLFGNTDKDRASNAADVLDAAVAQLKRLTKNDSAFDAIYAAAADQIGKFGISAGAKLFWKAGSDLFNQRKYTEAIAEYRKINPDFPLYELAVVNIARAQQVLGDFAAARKSLADFREMVSKTPLDSRDPKAQYRGTAIATAEFAESQMAYFEARGNEEYKLTRDLQKYPAAIDSLNAFLSNHAKDGEASVPTALEFLGRLHADLGELDRAEATYAQLKEKEPARASRLATEIFREYQSRVKTLGDELDQAIAKEKGDAAIQSATAAVQAMRKKLTALGLDYIQNSPQPQLAVLVNTLLGLEQLEDWKRVEEVAQRTLQLYGEDKNDTTKRIIDLTIRPKVGQALLRQGKFQQAYDMLVAAEQEAEKSGTKLWEVKRQIAFALGGWFSFDATGRPVREPGLDRPIEAYNKHFQEYRLWAERPDVKKYSLEWYEFQWECYWFARQAGMKDSKYKETAAKFFNIARSTDDFATLKRFGAEGERLFKYFNNNR